VFEVLFVILLAANSSQLQTFKLLWLLRGKDRRSSDPSVVNCISPNTHQSNTGRSVFVLLLSRIEGLGNFGGHNRRPWKLSSKVEKLSMFKEKVNNLLMGSCGKILCRHLI